MILLLWPRWRRRTAAACWLTRMSPASRAIYTCACMRAWAFSASNSDSLLCVQLAWRAIGSMHAAVPWAMAPWAVVHRQHLSDSNPPVSRLFLTQEGEVTAELKFLHIDQT
jgi:hypothetical protein